MGDEYQLRKDIDKIERDHSELNSKVSKSVFFADNSPLHEYGTTRENTGTLDGILDVLIAESGGGELINYYTKAEINAILTSYVTSQTLEDYQPLLESEVNIKTINNQSILGSGNLDIGGGSINIVTSWGDPTSDEKVPSEKLVKDTLDEKVDYDELHNLDINLTTLELVPKATNPNGVICFDDLQNKYIEKSNTTGLVKNDGTIDTTQYLSSLPSHNHDDRYYTESEVDTALNGKANSVHNHDDRYYTESEIDTALNGKQSTLVSGTNIKTINNESLLGSGNLNISSSSQNVFYGDCSTGASTQTKVVTVTNWSFTTGNILFVKFTNANSYNGTAIISIDGVTKDIATVGTTKTSRYYWKAGEVVGFVYDGTNMVLLEGGNATTTYYGITKLSSSTTSTSEVLSATPKAVKTAYDLADGKQDALVSGTNIKTINNESILGSGNISVGGGSNVTKTSDLTNDGEDGVNPFVSDDDSRLTNARTPTAHTHDDRYYTESEVDTALTGKQATLVSGTNIKTINGNSLLGSGNIVVGGTGTIDDTVTRNSSNPVKSSGIFSALQTKQDDFSILDNIADRYGSSIFADDGIWFYGICDRIYYDYNDTYELHFLKSDDTDVSFDDIILEGDSRLTNARTPTSHTHTKSQITDFPTLSTVATSGSYNDLTNKPSMQPIQILVTYTDNTTETIAFMKYTGN